MWYKPCFWLPRDGDVQTKVVYVIGNACPGCKAMDDGVGRHLPGHPGDVLQPAARTQPPGHCSPELLLLPAGQPKALRQPHGMTSQKGRTRAKAWRPHREKREEHVVCSADDNCLELQLRKWGVERPNLDNPSQTAKASTYRHGLSLCRLAKMASTYAHEISVASLQQSCTIPTISCVGIQPRPFGCPGRGTRCSRPPWAMPWVPRVLAVPRMRRRVESFPE